MSEGSLRAGAAAVTITPPLGVSLVGAYGDRRADGVITDLEAKALVLDDGGSAVAIVSLDLCHLDADVAARARARAASLAGIPAERVLITCTHTHSAPATRATPWYAPDPAYVDVLARRIGDAVALARQRTTPARLRAGRGAERSVAFNRRYWMRDGTLRTNPAFQDPAIVRPAGPIDPEVGVLCVEEARTGAVLALLVNYALHVAVVGGTRFSADFPGVLADLLRRVVGAQAVVLFAPGCGGDINHWNMAEPGPQSGQAVAERIGTVLAGEVLKVLARLAPVEPVEAAGGLAFARTVVELPLRVPSPDELAWATTRRGMEMRQMDADGLQAVAAHRILQVHEHGRPATTAEVQALAIGDLAYVSLPAEIFVELGLAIKEGSPFSHTLIAELNPSLYSSTYVPTEKAYGEGGYEATNSLLQPGGGERLVEAALSLVRGELRPTGTSSQR